MSEFPKPGLHIKEIMYRILAVVQLFVLTYLVAWNSGLSRGIDIGREDQKKEDKDACPNSHTESQPH